jgi:hypothetical protein
MTSGMLRRVFWQKFTDVSEVLDTSIIRAIALMVCDYIWTSEADI